MVELSDIYGHGRNTQKSRGYGRHSIVDPGANTHNTIDKEAHGRRRRILVQALVPVAISAYETSIVHQIETACKVLLEPTLKAWPLVSTEIWTPPQCMASWCKQCWLDATSRR